MKIQSNDRFDQIDFRLDRLVGAVLTLTETISLVKDDLTNLKETVQQQLMVAQEHSNWLSELKQVCYQQAETARQQAETARQQAETARQQAETARQQAETVDRIVLPISSMSQLSARAAEASCSPVEERWEEYKLDSDDYFLL
ncbi:hypothetical protein L1047_12695 [Synechococcus sp. Nb3U1]|uniref:hypothetical protein n=1 Tax=Synechococcus sp. Nb3U1 TaxID=1914529 RepID=UPI001F1EFF3E|nr:hypothetical protein [Synechococcus sp. Nb3U1]MCF2972054.1 hypothetical protein [Synechococcus sp. Nb3U1]